MPDSLALYYFPSCPYCKRVLNAAKRLGVELELRNTRTHPEHQRELMNARGRGTVPVLRYQVDGEDVWMPESADIVDFLKDRLA